MPWPESWCRPSHALEYMDRIIAERDAFGRNYIKTTESIAAVLDQVDPQLLFEGLTAEERVAWLGTLAQVHSVLSTWQRGERATLGMEFQALRLLLAKCGDEPKPVALPRLTFIAGRKLRHVVARDIDAVKRLINASEWKAATVLGGSVLEALLLDRLERPTLKARALAYGASKGWKNDLARWDLAHLIEAAEALQVIDDKVAGICSGVRHFRNMIHPGKERAQITPDSGTAHVAFGAIHTLLGLFNKPMA
jgi:hypothetical protein